MTFRSCVKSTNNGRINMKRRPSTEGVKGFVFGDPEGGVWRCDRHKHAKGVAGRKGTNTKTVLDNGYEEFSQRVNLVGTKAGGGIENIIRKNFNERINQVLRGDGEGFLRRVQKCEPRVNLSN